ncbi:Aspartate racemase [Penicillium angulare]|uniref:Aspartate racemase n=1 Tax=Penicillium angulare TaxID=116970 RepID=UPI0025421192|nr:Aspartate racemase [Penicillium angulare]KAJ5287822.1 Aspartate racemase [Penicillium angulare]
MKTIGIVGGIAWPSSLFFYKAINEYFKDRTQSNGLHTPNLILAQTNFALIEEAQSEGNWDDVGRLLAGEAANLKAAGADLFLLACNTLYTADEYIIKHSELPMLHIVDATANKVVQRGYKTVGLLGSRYTITGAYFADRLKKKNNLKVLVADGVHARNVHNALYQELAKNIFLPETRTKFKAAMEALVARGAEIVVLGCTEFGMLVK